MSDFSRTITLLRREKKCSQRDVADALGVSQSRLSHYEKGTREPGLDFVARIADFFGVTTDYLLGRSMMRDGAFVNEDNVYDAQGEKGNRLTGSVVSLLQKKLLLNAVSLLIDLTGKTGSKELMEAVSAYLGDVVYLLFRHVYDVSGENGDAFFSIPQELFSQAARADMAACELRLASLLVGRDTEGRKTPEVRLPALSHKTLLEEYPQVAQSLFLVLQQAGQRMGK